MYKQGWGLAQTWKRSWIWPWSWKIPGIWKKVPFVLELSLNFEKSPWKYELVLEKYKIRVLSDLWDAQKNFLKIAQNWVKITWYTSKSKVWLLLYSICAKSRFLSPESGSKKTSVPFHFDVFGWKKCIFCVVLYKIGKKLSPWKRKKPWNSPGILFSNFRTNPVQTINIFFLKFKFRKFEI